MKVQLAETKQQALLPQKPPFVMVDALVEATENSALARFFIDPENILVSGNHFSEAGLIECMAQSIALHNAYFSAEREQTDSPQIGYIVAIQKAIFLSLPSVNQQLNISLSVMHEIAGMKATQVSITDQKAQPVAEAVIKTFLTSS